MKEFRLMAKAIWNGTVIAESGPGTHQAGDALVDGARLVAVLVAIVPGFDWRQYISFREEYAVPVVRVRKNIWHGK